MPALKTINVNEDTWAALAKLKIDRRLDSIDAVILYLLGREGVKVEVKA